MVQVHINFEGGEHVFNVKVPFTADKIRRLIRDTFNIPIEAQSLFDYADEPSIKFELIGKRLFATNKILKCFMTLHVLQEIQTVNSNSLDVHSFIHVVRSCYV